MIDYEKIISPVVSALPPSGIRKFFDIVAEMDDAISLGVGEPDFTTPWAIREAGIYSLEKGQTHYTANAGLMELREEICNYYDRKFDIKYNPKKEVLVTVGGSEAIDLMVRTLINPGDEVLIPEPCFVCYRPCTVMAGGVPVLIETKEEDITQAFDRLSKGRTTLVIAHRLSTIRNADEIAVVDEHGIAEMGTHDELLAAGGEYKKLHEAQNRFYVSV